MNRGNSFRDNIMVAAESIFSVIGEPFNVNLLEIVPRPSVQVKKNSRRRARSDVGISLRISDHNVTW